MNTYQKYILGILAGVVCLSAVSCSDKADHDSIIDRGEISFSAQVGNTGTKMTDNSWEGGEVIGVKVAETEKTYIVDKEGAMTVSGSDPYEWNGVAFDAEAWYPYTDEQIVLTDQTSEEKFYACDMLYSHTSVYSKEASFVFNHKMTRMWWQLQEVTGYDEEEEAAAKVTFYGYASMTYDNGSVTPAGNPDQEIRTWDRTEGGKRVGEAIMVPCEMWDKPLIKVEIGGDTYVFTPTKAADTEGRNTGVLKENSLQQYWLSISKEDFTVKMTSGPIGQWETSDMGAVHPEIQ